jgi:sulfoxide reductase heme-binding subunit YedZ
MRRNASSSSFNLQRAINAIPRWAVYGFGALPGVWIFWLALNNRLGADPLKTLEQILGLWALRFIIAGLAVTPLRRLGGLSLLRYRRALGLLAFFYAFAHLLVYLVLDQGLDLRAIGADVLRRPYITIGMFAFLILVPLAITSNAPMIKRLGAAAWQRLHRWVYIAAIAAAVHFIMVVKSWPPEPLVYAGLIVVLLLIRLILPARKRLFQAAPRAA